MVHEKTEEPGPTASRTRSWLPRSWKNVVLAVARGTDTRLVPVRERFRYDAVERTTEVAGSAPNVPVIPARWSSVMVPAGAPRLATLYGASVGSSWM
jgi:hypothetical protein